MSRVGPSMLPSEERSIRLFARPDLVIRRGQFQGENCWILKDPVALKYFRLPDPEFEVFQLLDGRHSLAQIKHHLELTYPDRPVEVRELQNLVNSFHQGGLAIADEHGQGDVLLVKGRKQFWRKWRSKLMSILAIQFPGVDPDRFLNWSYPKLRWFFTPWCVAAVILIILAAILLLLANLDEFYRRLPEFQRFFGGENLVLMGATLILTKSLHELGHALVCKHFGGECHEIGVMLLLFAPTMYCNTSDSWILPNKWHRIAIALGGVFFELFLAAICTFIWWNTQPGGLHYLCLNIMFLSSTSAILFNLNPLMRYDGYYVLSDLIEIPNLTQKSRMALISQLRSFCLGLPKASFQQLPKSHLNLYAGFALSSIVYRWVITIGILWFLSEVFEPWGLQVFGQFLIAFVLFGMIVVPLWKLGKYLSYPGRIRQVSRTRLLVSASVLGTALMFSLFVPVPQYVTCPVVVRPLDAVPIYVTVPGVLETIQVQPGEAVSVGDPLATLTSYEHQLESARLEGRIAKLEAELIVQRQMFAQRQGAATDFVTKTSQLRSLQQQLDQWNKQSADLTISATASGQLFEPASIPDPTIQLDSELGQWSGSPLDRANRGAYLENGTLLGHIGNPDSMEAVLVIDQADFEKVQVGNHARIMLDEYPGLRINGSIAELAKTSMEATPPELSNAFGGPLPQEAADHGNSNQALLVRYEGSVVMDGTETTLKNGFRGQARIRVESTSIASWCYRAFLDAIQF